MKMPLTSLNKWIAGAVIISLAVIIYFATREYQGMFFSAIIIFALFRKMQKKLVEKGWNKSLASATTLLTSFISLLIPLLTIISILVGGIAGFFNDNREEIVKNIQNIPSLIQQDSAFLNTELYRGFSIRDALSSIQIDYGAIVTNISDFLRQFITSFTAGTSSFFLQLVVMYFILFFLFRDMDKYRAFFYKYSPFSETNSKKLVAQFDNMTYANIVGSSITALSQGIAMWIGFSLFGLPGGLFWGFVTAIAAFIPIIGPPIVWIPAVAALFLQGNTWGAIGLLLWSLVIVTWIDNVVRPIVTSKVGNIHPLIAIVGIFIGLPMFGILGLILGPALLSFFLTTLDMYYEEFVHKN